MSVAIVTDSTAYFIDTEKDKYDYYVVPLTITQGEENFPEGSKYSNKEFFDRLRTAKSFPTSSQPAVGEFAKMYKELLNKYEVIISIHLAGVLSGTVRSAQAAADLVDANRITVLDSRSTAQGLSAMIVEACKMVQAGKPVIEIINTIKTMADNSSVFFLIDTLDYLHKGGRIGGAAAVFGNLLQIKPILYLQPDGKVDVFDKVRTTKKAEARLIEAATQAISNNVNWLKIHVVHADNLGKAKHIEELLKHELPNANTVISELGPVIGMHVGPDTYGFIITPMIL